MDKNLRLIAGFIVSESKLSKSAKVQLLNWIQKEATDSQVKALLLDGEIVYLDEQAEEIVNKRFKSSPLNEGIFKSILGGLLLTPAGWILYRGIRAAVSRKSAQCGALGIGKKRDICLLKLKAEEAQKMAQLISKEAKNCVHSSNPEKCKKAAMENLNKYNEKARKYMDKIRKYSQKSIKKQITAQKGLEKAKRKEASVI